MTSAEQATRALEQIKDAGSGKTTLELGWIDQVRISPPRAVFRLNLPGFAQSQRERIAAEARELLMGLEADLVLCESIIQTRRLLPRQNQ